MDAISMLPLNERCVRSKLALFLRLWMARHRYEQGRPFGSGSAECIRYHLNRLRQCWDRVAGFQRALGLDVVSFEPREQFEIIAIASAYVQRELDSPQNTIIDIADAWREYTRLLDGLSHQMNRYDFSDACARCQQIIARLNDRAQNENNIIPLNPPGSLLQHAAMF